MEQRASFVAIRPISHGLESRGGCHATSADVVIGSSAWIGRGLSCVCAQRRGNNDKVSIGLTPFQIYFQRLLQKQKGERATWEYPFAVAGVNITFMLIQMLDLRSERNASGLCKTGVMVLPDLPPEFPASEILKFFAIHEDVLSVTGTNYPNV